MVTLETNVSNITCGKTNAAGQTFFSDCDTLSFAASVMPGETAFLRGTLNYHYTDDGLPLPVRQAIQVDAGGFTMVPVTYEAGANDGVKRVPLMFTPGDQPDDITGSKDLFVTVGLPPGGLIGYTSNLFVSFQPRLFAAPIPEPATVALTTCGLLALGLAARRRREPVNLAAVA